MSIRPSLLPWRWNLKEVKNQFIRSGEQNTHTTHTYNLYCLTTVQYSARKITESLGNVTVRGENGKRKGGARWPTVCLSMYNITENIYYSQLSSVAILLQHEPKCFTSHNTRKGLCFLSLCAIVFRSPPSSHVSNYNGQRSSQLFCVHYTNLVFHGYNTYCYRG
jgi:hypothetical protein